MARNVGTVIQNNLSRGVITEATGLNFPDNAAVDAENVIFDPIGSVRRRKGFDVEGSAVAQRYRDSDGLIQEFVWQSVAKTGGFTFLVLQMGDQVLFYELTSSEAISVGAIPVALDLRDYRAPGAENLSMTPCTFSAGAGYLFVAHPKCDPVIVRWNETRQDFEAARVSIRIRDFEGVEDTEGLLDNPVGLTTPHHYNLRNQGWNQMVRVGANSNEVGQGGSLGGLPVAGDPLEWSPLTPPTVDQYLGMVFGLGGLLDTNIRPGRTIRSLMGLGGELSGNIQVGSHNLASEFSLGGEVSIPIRVIQRLSTIAGLGGEMRAHIYPPTVLRANFSLGGETEANAQLTKILSGEFELGGEYRTNVFTGMRMRSVMELGGEFLSNVNVTPSAPMDPDAQAVIDLMSPTPNLSRQALINKTIIDLKNAGIWNKLEMLHVFAAHSVDASVYDWRYLRSRTNPAPAGYPFVADQGFSRVGPTTGKMSFGFPTTGTGWNVYSPNSAHLMAFVVSDAGTSIPNPPLISGNSSISDIDLWGGAPSGLRYRINSSTFVTVPALTDNLGMTLVSRSSSSATSAYRNGVKIGDFSSSTTAISNAGLGLLQYDNTTLAEGIQVGIISIGSNLTEQEVSDFYTILSYYLDNLEETA